MGAEAAWGLEYSEQLGLVGGVPREGMLTGEASPSYIGVPSRIYAFNPNCKIIIALRDPVARAVSQLRQYYMYEFRGTPEGFIQQYDTENLARLDAVIDSNYLRRLQVVARYLSARTDRPGQFRAFTREPQLVMNRLFRWLGLDVRVIEEEYRGAQTEVQYDESVIRARLEKHFASMRGQVAAEIAGKNLFLVPDDISQFNNY